MIEIKNLLNKVLLFYLPVKQNYWNGITRCNLDKKPGIIGKYYLDFKSKVNYPDRFDDEGIPLFRYKKKFYYHPIVICQYAFGLFQFINDDKVKDKFLLQADWLIKNGKRNNGSMLWYFNLPVKEYKINYPWISAMAQGEAISVLTRAYLITNNEKYLLGSIDGMKAFTKNTDDEGVINYFKDILVFEEYPSKKVSAVLNGFVFSLFGLYDLMLLKVEKAEDLFIRGIQSLIKLLPFYDMKYWSSYDLYNYPDKFPASFTYHSIHVEQLKALYILTTEKIFLEYATNWENYYRNIFHKTLVLIHKIKSKLSQAISSGESN